jgi:hypothetical protein
MPLAEMREMVKGQRKYPQIKWLLRKLMGPLEEQMMVLTGSECSEVFCTVIS